MPNLACIVGVFTFGFGIGASVLTNNVAALAALTNGVRPMRKVAALEAERRHLLELQLREAGFGSGITIDGVLHDHDEIVAVEDGDGSPADAPFETDEDAGDDSIVVSDTADGLVLDEEAA